MKVPLHGDPGLLSTMTHGGKGPNHVPYLPHLPANWWSADGRSGVLLFSGDYTENGPTPHNSPSSYYGVVTRRFRLVSGGKGG